MWTFRSRMQRLPSRTFYFIVCLCASSGAILLEESIRGPTPRLQVRLDSLNSVLESYGIVAPKAWNECITSQFERRLLSAEPTKPSSEELSKWPSAKQESPIEFWHGRTLYSLKADACAFPFSVSKYINARKNPQWTSVVTALGEKQRRMGPCRHVLSVVASNDSRYVAVFGVADECNCYVQLLETEDGSTRLFAVFPKFDL